MMENVVFSMKKVPVLIHIQNKEAYHEVAC